MALVELLQKSSDGDFLRAVAEAALQILMEADVEGLIGAGRRTNAPPSGSITAVAIASALSTPASAPTIRRVRRHQGVQQTFTRCAPKTTAPGEQPGPPELITGSQQPTDHCGA